MSRAFLLLIGLALSNLILWSFVRKEILDTLVDYLELTIDPRVHCNSSTHHHFHNVGISKRIGSKARIRTERMILVFLLVSVSGLNLYLYQLFISLAYIPLSIDN